MQITHSSTDTGTDTARGPADWFTGDVFIDTVRNPDEQSAIGCAHVRFTPGARTAWHSHPKGQTLYVTDGVGRVARRGGDVQRSGRATSYASSPARSTGTARRPAASWRTWPCRRRTSGARS